MERLSLTMGKEIQQAVNSIEGKLQKQCSKFTSEEGKGYSLQYSGLENSMDCIVHVVAKSQTQLSNFQFTSSLHLFYI